MENLHSQVIDNKARELVLVSEALHSQKLNSMSERITAGHKKRLICISGPSGSGKTTTAERLSIHLRAMGVKPLAVSLDDYFLDREKTPATLKATTTSKPSKPWTWSLLTGSLRIFWRAGRLPSRDSTSLPANVKRVPG